MLSFSDILHFLVTGYAVLVAVAALWGLAAFRAWGRHGYNHPPTFLEYYPPWQFAPYRVRYSHCAPRPVDISKAALLTLLPIVNVYMMGIPFFLFLVVATYRGTRRTLAWLSYRATGDEKRLATWFFSPISRRH